ncbi:substrate-binding periplasmic protein [Chitinimonas koreensis]|uniref:substrate-binding periplasmic protein n=1 Tax=Chitinimonas koreensis TaxID=356302 RepID=UPI00040D34B1|nr:transporter substrate-binding domain-containing protein [Chitinimonas koreensis]QNM98576.1 transporter substrate-binding domain-containing protein [Chitinimonas koreensis]
MNRRILLQGIAVTALFAAGLEAQALTFTTEDYPPFNMAVDKKVAGISTDILQDAIKRAGVSAEFKLLPWERALDMAKTQADVCVYSAVRTPEREKLFKWVGPLVADEITLFAKADSAIKLGGVNDAKKYKVGGYNGDAYGDFVEKQGIKLERVTTDVQNLPKLAAGRIDLWVAGAQSGPYKASREGMKGAIKPLLALGDPKDSQMYLACNPGVPDDVVKKLNDAVQAVKKDGSADKIGAKYK